jgi:trimeric autotransporter adhesin
MKTQTPTILITLLCLAATLPKAQAVTPAPDGGYPGGTTAEGHDALLTLTTGTYNTGIGLFSLLSNAEGNFNTAVGAGTLLSNTAGRNTATGAGALLSNTTGDGNTANGMFALFSNSTGNQNMATGAFALFSNTGNFNTASGTFALNDNTTGISNTAIGFAALVNNTTGSDNTATGGQALLSNTTGDANTATGTFALNDNTTGAGNTAIGFAALVNNTTGNGDTGLGIGAGSGVTTASNVIAIGNPGQDVSNSCYVGNIYSNIQPQVGIDPDRVTINSSGRLGRANVSSRRYKHDIKPMHKASETIYALKPVSFRYRKQYDATQAIAFGLIAEDVAEVLPELVGRNEKGEPESVRYDEVNAMLLNEFLKEHSKVEKLEATVTCQQKQIEALTAGLQKVTAQIEMKERTPQIADKQ